MVTQDTKYLNALLSGSKKEASGFVRELRSGGASIIELYDGVMRESLYEVGKLWEYNKISVAAEHLATAITESVLNEIYPDVIQPYSIEKKALITCAENEFHQVGAKMTADVFELFGWDTYFLGANIPTSELIKFSSTLNLDVIGISLSIFFHIPELEKMIIEFRKNGFNCPIIIGGQAFTHGGLDILQRHDNVYYIADLKELEQFIKKQA